MLSNWRGVQWGLGLTILAILGVLWFSALEAYSNLPLVVTMVSASLLLWLVEEWMGILLVLVLSLLDVRTQWHAIDIRVFEAFTIAAAPLSVALGRFGALARRGVPAALKAFLPYFVWSVLTIASSISPRTSAIFDLRLAVTVLFAWIASGATSELKDWRADVVEMTLSAGLILIVMVGAYQQIVGKAFLNVLADGNWVPFMSGESLSRANGSFYVGHSGNLRPFSFFVTPHVHAIVVGLVSLYLVGRKDARPYARIGGALGLTSLLVSDVYGAIVGLGAVVATFIFVKAARRSRGAVWIVLMTYATAISVGVYKIGWLVGQLVERGFGIRLQIWAVGFESFRHHMLFGAGPGTSTIILSDFNTSFGYNFDHLHNWFLQTATETGLVGLLAFLAFILGLGSLAARQHKMTGPTAWVTSLATAFFLGCNIVDSFAGGGNIALLWFFVVLALATAPSSIVGQDGHSLTSSPGG